MINIDENYSTFSKKETASFILSINIETKAQLQDDYTMSTQTKDQEMHLNISTRHTLNTLIISIPDKKSLIMSKFKANHSQ